MPRKPRNIGASVRARLLDRARAERSDFQILLTRYALERLLYRLSVSAHRERFILKGAMLFVTWVADPFRPTRDLDLLGFGDNGAAALADTFRAICAEPVADDGVTFDSAGLEAAPIREDAEYGGVRVRTTATIAGARIPIQVDIGFGDAVTPAPVEIDYPTLLDAPAPHLRTYPVETVVAEKFEALVTLTPPPATDTDGVGRCRSRLGYSTELSQSCSVPQGFVVNAVGSGLPAYASSFFSPLATILSALSGNGRCSFRASGAGAVIQ